MISLIDVQRGYDRWAAKPHNAKWVRKIDGTPIANDIVVNIFDELKDIEPKTPADQMVGTWLPIERADKTITDVQSFPEVGMTISMSDRYWVRDDDGRVYEAAWSEGNNDRDFWWDFEGESPVDPVEFMPHPLDPRFHPDAKLEDQP